MSLQTVYLNGDFMPMEQARISPMDRGFLFADGVYEVIPVYQGQLFEWEAHYQRLENSLAGVFINNPMDNQAWLSVLQQLITLHPWPDQFIYLQISRGLQIPRDHLPQADLTPSVFVYTNPLKPLAEKIISHGIKVITLDDIRWQRCDIKSIALLPNVMAKMHAQAAGVDDVVLINPQGYVTEGSASNMMMVKAGEIITPPLSTHILPGITRQVIEKIANRHHIPFIEREIHQTEISSADELWLASSTKEALPICQLNGQAVGSGHPGRVWQQLRQLYQDYKIQTRTHSTI